MKATQIVLASRPTGIPSFENFRLENIVLPELTAGQILIQPCFISVDPYMRGKMNDLKSHPASFKENEPITGGIVGLVLESKSSQYTPGNIVKGTLPWATKIIHQDKGIQKIETNLIPISYHLGILGMPGLTAYYGLLRVGQPKPGETVFISGAAGAVGSVVGQIAKINGCRVVGLTGSDDKVKLLKEHFGFDAAINYKTSKNLRKDIQVACPNDIDIYFDNVGGEISDAVFTALNYNSRVIICGQISLYNETRMQMGPRILMLILNKCILVKGLNVDDYSAEFRDGVQQLYSWVEEGKLRFKETIVKGFDRLPEAFLGLFAGQNQGKMLV